MLFCCYLTHLGHPLMSSPSCGCLIIKTLLELDYLVKVTPKQFIICAPTCSIYYVEMIFDLEIDIWPRGSPQITKIISERPFVALFGKKSYFCLPDLEIDTLTLKMIFIHQNKSRNGFFVKITLKRRTTLSAIYVCKNRIFDLGIDFWWPWIELDREDNLEPLKWY